MSQLEHKWPRKTRELQTAILDSTRWNRFNHREGDVVVGSWAKAGTTWVMQVAAQLLWGAPADMRIGPMQAPWLDMRTPPLDVVLGLLETQQHRRLLKTHLPVDALAFSQKAKYLYIARDIRDIAWSAYNHQAGFTQNALNAFNDSPGRVGPPVSYPPCDLRGYYLRFLEEGVPPGFCMAPFWTHVQGWWDIRDLPNVRLLHYNNLQNDLAGAIRRIAEFLGVDIGMNLKAILEHCRFDYMRNSAYENKAASAALNLLWENGAMTFFNQGINGRWKNVLSAEEIAQADEAAARNLTPDCAHWLKSGELQNAAD
jgi:aryl sulfotransferase